jgi:hypothetical protein
MADNGILIFIFNFNFRRRTGVRSWQSGPGWTLACDQSRDVLLGHPAQAVNCGSTLLVFPDDLNADPRHHPLG